MREAFEMRISDPEYQTAKQIREAASEMHQRLESSPNWSDDDQHLQARFGLCCDTGQPRRVRKMLGATPSLALGTHFLRENKDWLK